MYVINIQLQEDKYIYLMVEKKLSRHRKLKIEQHKPH